jgi:hypothetical protein
MFVIDGRPLPVGIAFVDANNIQRPSNWLELATPQERVDAGVQEMPDPPDSRFYSGFDEQGLPIPKNHADLVIAYQNEVRSTANGYLRSSDWMVIRQADNGTEMPLDWKLWRELVRIKTGEKVAAINATTTTEELAAYITGAEYPVWPADPSQPIPESADDTISFEGGVTSAQIVM